VPEFAEYNLYDNLYAFGALPAFTNQSSVDYLYFQNVSGRWVYGSPEWFRLDALHLNKYNLTEFRHDPNLSGAWYLNEGTGLVAYGSSRISEDADLHEATWITGRLGNALFFDGINDYVEINDPRARLDMNYSVTLSAWINATTDVLDPHTIIARLDGSKWPYNLAVSQSTGAITFDYTFNGGSPNVVSLTGPAVNDAKWHHVAATRDDEAGTAELYVDGELVDSESYTGTVDSAAAGYIWIGRSPGGAGPFSGVIDEVKIWNRALSKEEVKEEYERGWKTY